MGIEHGIQVVVAWVDILVVTAGYILIRAIIVVVCTAVVIIAVRRMRNGA